MYRTARLYIAVASDPNRAGSQEQAFVDAGLVPRHGPCRPVHEVELQPEIHRMKPSSVNGRRGVVQSDIARGDQLAPDEASSQLGLHRGEFIELRHPRMVRHAVQATEGNRGEPPTHPPAR